MGYFSNGSEGLGFQECYCFHCVHWKDHGELQGDRSGEGCPIWDVHNLYSYGAEGELESALNMLILRHPERSNQCAFFEGTCETCKHWGAGSVCVHEDEDALWAICGQCAADAHVQTDAEFSCSLWKEGRGGH